MYLVADNRAYNWVTANPEPDTVPSTIDILQSHHSDSWGWALACCDWHRQQAEDVLQESYLRVLDGRARFSGRSTEKTWFYGVIRRVAAEFHRGQARRGLFGRQQSVAANEHETAYPMQDGLELDQSSRRLRALLLQLSPRQREVLHLVFYSDLSLEEAARVTGLSVGSARTHYHRGKQQLARLMEENDEKT